MHNTWIYIAVMAIVSYIIRALPLTLIRRPITNTFVKSFLYYVPYVTLAVMTFPAILSASNSMIAGLAAFVIGVILSWRQSSLLQVSVICCVAVFIIECFI